MPSPEEAYYVLRHLEVIDIIQVVQHYTHNYILPKWKCDLFAVMQVWRLLGPSPTLIRLLAKADGEQCGHDTHLAKRE